MKRTRSVDSFPLPGFQIAPMIDVVFVVMLFFMVLVGSQRTEADIGISLPQIEYDSAGAHLPDAEIILGVEEDGSVGLNDEPFDHAGDARLPELERTLRRLSATTSSTKTRVLATIHAAPETSYQRVTDVLDALHVAGIEHVTFGVGQE